MRIREALQLGRHELAGQAAARLEAEILLAFCLGAPRSLLYAQPELELSEDQSGGFQALLQRRRAGEPIAYVTGVREFWSLRLHVTPAVLIPRPETELLVERALELIPADSVWRIADLGTGSGAVALALAKERPACEVHAVDLSGAALEVAKDNARRLGLERVRFHQGHWCEPLAGAFRLIAANPPYVGEDDPHLHTGDCRFEPRQALTPGPDALAAIREIASQTRGRLEPGGWLMLEHGPGQGEGVREVMEKAGFRDVSTLRDLLGHERLTVGRTPG